MLMVLHTKAMEVAIIVTALAPLERLDAIRQLRTNPLTHKWFVLLGLAIIAVLVIAFVTVSYRQRSREKYTDKSGFDEHAEYRGLTIAERTILLDIAESAGVEKVEAIFVEEDAFEHGAAEVVRQKAINNGEAACVELSTTLAFLRDKLGFHERTAGSIGSAAQTRRLSSRQMPVGKRVRITRRAEADAKDIECQIIQNNEAGVRVQLLEEIKSRPGETWRVYCNFGAFLWEFDSFVIACDSETMFLYHSQDVHSINRRRFWRVPVECPALIAHFPFAAKPVVPLDNNQQENSGKDMVADGSHALDLSLEFEHATVVELGGPGLRLETRLQVTVGERVLVIFRLHVREAQKTGHQKTVLIQDIGEVRNASATDNGTSVAVELTGLTDSDVDWLVKATDEVAKKDSVKNKDNLQQVQQSSAAEAGVVGRSTQNAEH